MLRCAANVLIAWLVSAAPLQAATLLFQETFTTASLNRTYWVPYVCDNNSHGWPWSMQSGQPQPSSAFAGSGFYADYDLPSFISTGNGLTLKAQRGTTASGFTWTGSVICSYPVTNTFGATAGFTFTNGYIEVRARMPYAGTGSWPAIWFLPGPGTSGAEIDLHEGGFISGATDPDQIMACFLQSSGNSQKLIKTGVSLSADYHLYGLEYLRGQAVRMYLDGALVASYSNNIPTCSYYIILNNSIATAKASYWHSQTNSSTPSPNAMLVSYVRLYNSRPQPTTNAPIQSIRLVGTNVWIHGTNNNGGQNFHYTVLASTNLGLARSYWTRLATNGFKADGTYDYTNAVNRSTPQRFFDTMVVP